MHEWAFGASQCHCETRIHFFPEKYNYWDVRGNHIRPLPALCYKKYLAHNLFINRKVSSPYLCLSTALRQTGTDMIRTTAQSHSDKPTCRRHVSHTRFHLPIVRVRTARPLPLTRIARTAALRGGFRACGCRNMNAREFIPTIFYSVSTADT